MLASYTSPGLLKSLVCSEKKNILDLGTGFSVGGVRKKVGLAFLFVSLWRHHLHKGTKFWLKVWLYSSLENEALEA